MMLAKRAAMNKDVEVKPLEDVPPMNDEIRAAPSPPLSNGHASSVVPDLIPGKNASSDDEEFKPALDHFDDENALLNQLEMRYGQPRGKGDPTSGGVSSSDGVDLLTGSPATADRQIKSR